MIRRLVYLLLAAGVLVGLGLGMHALLQQVAAGDGAWSTRAASTCAACHGG